MKIFDSFFIWKFKFTSKILDIGENCDVFLSNNDYNFAIYTENETDKK